MQLVENKTWVSWTQTKDELCYIEELVITATRKIKENIDSKLIKDEIVPSLYKPIIYLDLGLFKQRKIGFYGFKPYIDDEKIQYSGAYTLDNELIEPYISNDIDFNRLYNNLFFYMEGLNDFTWS